MSLPMGWVEARLAELLPLTYGKSLVEAARDAVGDIPVYGSSGIVGHHSEALVAGETLIVGRKGTVGAVHHSRVPCWVIDTAYYVDPTAPLNWRFFYFLLLHLQLANLDRSTAIPGLSRDDYNKIIISIAPASEQNRIVAEIEKQFTRLDDAVAALKRVQLNLRRHRSSLLKAACEGRLVPTEAELARKEERDYEPANELLKRILAERRAKWEAHQLRKMTVAGKPPTKDEWKKKYREPQKPSIQHLPKLPEGWIWTTVEQISCAVQYGSSAKCSEEGDVPVLRMANITLEGQIVTDKLKFLPSRHVEFPELLLKKNDLLFNRTNSAELVGKSAIYKGFPHPCSFASYLIRVSLLDGCHPDYLAACLNSGFGKQWIKAVLNQQVGQANVNGSKLLAFVFPLPPVVEQARISEKLAQEIDTSLRIEQTIGRELAKATNFRRSVLQVAFGGGLVAQESSDEPASALLERIRAQHRTRNGSAETTQATSNICKRSTNDRRQEPEPAKKSVRRAGAPKTRFLPEAVQR